MVNPCGPSDFIDWRTIIVGTVRLCSRFDTFCTMRALRLFPTSAWMVATAAAAAAQYSKYGYFMHTVRSPHILGEFLCVHSIWCFNSAFWMSALRTTLNWEYRWYTAATHIWHADDVVRYVAAEFSSLWSRASMHKGGRGHTEKEGKGINAANLDAFYRAFARTLYAQLLFLYFLGCRFGYQNEGSLYRDSLRGA